MQCSAKPNACCCTRKPKLPDCFESSSCPIDRTQPRMRALRNPCGRRRTSVSGAAKVGWGTVRSGSRTRGATRCSQHLQAGCEARGSEKQNQQPWECAFQQRDARFPNAAPEYPMLMPVNPNAAHLPVNIPSLVSTVQFVRAQVLTRPAASDRRPFRRLPIPTVPGAQSTPTPCSKPTQPNAPAFPRNSRRIAATHRLVQWPPAQRKLNLEWVPRLARGSSHGARNRTSGTRRALTGAAPSAMTHGKSNRPAKWTGHHHSATSGDWP